MQLDLSRPQLKVVKEVLEERGRYDGIRIRNGGQDGGVTEWSVESQTLSKMLKQPSLQLISTVASYIFTFFGWQLCIFPAERG